MELLKADRSFTKGEAEIQNLLKAPDLFSRGTSSSITETRTESMAAVTRDADDHHDHDGSNVRIQIYY